MADAVAARGGRTAFALLVAWMLWRLAARTDWTAVLASARSRTAAQLCGIAALALAGHAVYGLLDVVGRGLAGHRLPLWRTWLTATTCYAMNLNLGGAVGGVGFRLRLYGRQGVPAARIGRVIAGSILANWTGYLLLLATMPFWAPDGGLARWTGQGGTLAISLGAGVRAADAPAGRRPRGLALRGAPHGQASRRRRTFAQIIRIASSSGGLTRCRSKPASSVRRRSSGWPQPVTATSVRSRPPSCRRRRRASS